jgi:hypothetical protein
MPKAPIHTSHLETKDQFILSQGDDVLILQTAGLAPYAIENGKITTCVLNAPALFRLLNPGLHP